MKNFKNPKDQQSEYQVEPWHGMNSKWARVSFFEKSKKRQQVVGQSSGHFTPSFFQWWNLVKAVIYHLKEFCRGKNVISRTGKQFWAPKSSTVRLSFWVLRRDHLKTGRLVILKKSRKRRQVLCLFSVVILRCLFSRSEIPWKHTIAI